METPILVAVALLCAAAAAVWTRSARFRYRSLLRIEAQRASIVAEGEDTTDVDALLTLARSSWRKEVHIASVYVSLALAVVIIGVADQREWTAVLGVLAIPALVSIMWARSTIQVARLTQERYDLERRAKETLAQEDLAPKAWAGRLAPDEFPDFTGFEVGRVYQAGSGLMAGDFYDVFRVAPKRLAAVIGDVAGHGIESSITAFQAKYLLRVFLRQFRDPAQAMEELNRQMCAADRGEEFISLVVVVFDTEAGTVRFASAGHPTSLLWHKREVQPLRATGPLVMLDPEAQYFSREIGLDLGDLVLMYTDGLSEVRQGDELFGEDRIAATLRRDPTVAPDVLCKSLLEVARDFSAGPIKDDVAIMAIRRS